MGRKRGDKDKVMVVSSKKKTQKKPGVQGMSSQEDWNRVKLFDQVFANALIGNQISSYMSHCDLKMASVACRTLFNMVRDSQNFAKTTKLCLIEDNLLGGLENVYSTLITTRGDGGGGGAVPFRGWGIIELDLDFGKEILKILQNSDAILQNVHTIRLIRHRSTDEGVRSRGVLLLQYIFSRISVVTLQMDLELYVGQLDFSKIFPNRTGYFSNLQALEILSPASMFDYQNDVFDCEYANNFGYFPTCPLKLKKVGIGAAMGFKWKNSAIFDLLAANSTTIQELRLELKDRSVWETSKLTTIRFPQLKKLTTSLSDGKGETENFLTFFEKQPLLTELSLHVRVRCDQKLLSLIKKKGTNLQKFHLRAKIIGNDKDAVDWSFLAGMKNLKDFALIRPQRNEYNASLQRSKIEGNGISFFKSLPSTLIRLKLKGVRNFWWDSDLCTDIGDEEKMDLLRRFPNLENLTILRSQDAMNDRVLQGIIREMPKLVKLELSGCRRCTDFGITGVSKAEEISGVNLTSLKGLTDITLSGFKNISAEAILDSISHPFLHNLTVVAKDKMTVLQALELVEENPTLEELAIRVENTNAIVRDGATYHRVDKLKLDDLENELKASSSRLSHVSFIGDYEEEDGDFDDDTDASEIDFSDSDDDYSSSCPCCGSCRCMFCGCDCEFHCFF